MAKQRRLKKDLATNPGMLIIEVIGGETKTFDPALLPEEIQAKLPAIALSHKLGDASSGLSDVELIQAAIDTVWDSMMEGKMTTRKPGQPKVNLTDVKDNMEKLDDVQKAAAQELLKTLGITL